LILLAQVVSTWAMTGIIWFVQLVQYPGFSLVDPNAFPEFHARHSNSISVIVGPLMILEAASAFAFLWRPLAFQSAGEVWLGVVLVLVIWGSTFLLQVPLHTKLGSGFDEAVWRALVRSNWIRTVAWSARAALVTFWLWRALLSNSELSA
jgi:hypothetical protein